MSTKFSEGFAAIAAFMVVVLAVGGGTAYYFYTQVQNLEKNSTAKKEERSQKPTNPPQNEIDENKPSETPQETITLSAVGDFIGRGQATRNFDGEEFIHTVTAQLEEPDEGKFYEGWLVTQQPEPKFISTGKLVRDGDVYSLEFSIDTDYSSYSKVVITEETEEDGLDGIPEVHVLEGSF